MQESFQTAELGTGGRGLRDALGAAMPPPVPWTLCCACVSDPVLSDADADADANGQGDEQRLRLVQGFIGQVSFGIRPPNALADHAPAVWASFRCAAPAGQGLPWHGSSGSRLSAVREGEGRGCCSEGCVLLLPTVCAC